MNGLSCGVVKSGTMKSPFTGKEMKAMKEWREMTFRDKAFPVIFHTYLCEDTGEKFEDEQLSVMNYNQVLDQYREGHTLQLPE